ncbi:acyltransferase domain-containing protein [Clostridium felsineum]|uniref:type I polyketide synthase n=1 Tax=Clostridium felsineum TaxID=36839 RepID=UPI00214D47C3|nr:type I polyketide synthase [Clostridium felsineum]MCR3758484.1 acyltransferase domain-containing protein [Clostridium felsineum]
MSDIAVIGIACRLPGNSNSPDEFWHNLCQGKDLTRDIKNERWDKERYYNPNKKIPGKMYTKHGGFIDSIDKFDPSFFGISPREANYMDPQQRILLEVTDEAMQDGGIIPKNLAGKKIGVYVGAFTVDYQLLSFSERNQKNIDVYSSAGVMMTMISNRISYIYNLKGPSMTIDTACSSSLVATHIACQAIKSGDCEMALVAGVNVIIAPQYTVSECKGGFLSPDGRCKTFDSKANGYARGEGAGVVILKPLDKALEDGNYIYSVIKATGSNQDGHTDGITVPNQDSQEALLRETCKKANVLPCDINYMEAHGTGTAVGDPIEANAIGNVVKKGRENKPDCIIGSVKANIGHLEAASGIASLIKVSLMLKNKKIPPHINLKEPNPKIDFKNLRLKVNTELSDFKSTNEKLVVGINSFGFGGTNANVILESFENREKQECIQDNGRSNIVTISAKTKEALNEYALNIKNYMSNNNVFYKDVIYTLLNNRAHYENRLAFIAKSKKQMLQYLDDFINDIKTRKDIFYGESTFKNKKNVVFVYTGMGPIWWAMGRELLEKQPVFRKSIKKCDELINKYAGWSILEKMLSNEEESELDQPQYGQPANFALQVALTDLWRSYGIEANAIVGHSVGEVAAAYVSGSLTLQQAVKVSIERSKAQQKMINKGTMLYVEISEDKAKELINNYKECVSIGVVNSDNSVTLSGSRKKLEELQNILENKGIFSKFLRVNVAYHSYQMDPLQSDFEESIKGLVASRPNIPIYSTVTGEKNTGALYGEDYWWNNIRKTVRFKEAVNNLLDEGYNLFIEIGPHPVLKNAIKECIERKNKKGEVLHSLIRKQDEESTFYNSLAHIYTLGYNVNIKNIIPSDGKFIKIPLYPWQNKSYWNETDESKELRTGINKDYILGRKLRDPITTWENDISFNNYPYLKDHKVQNVVLFPGAGYLEMAWSFVRKHAANDVCEIKNVKFNKAMFIKEESDTRTRFVFDSENNGFRIYSMNLDFADSGEWALNAKGTIQRCLESKKNERLNIENLMKNCLEEINKEQCYKIFAEQGFQYGEKFQNIEKVYKGNKSALCYINLSDSEFLNTEKHVMHSVIIDACFQGTISLMPHCGNNERRSFLPTNVENMFIYNAPQKNMVVYTFITSSTEKYIKSNIVLCDMSGNIILKMDGFTVYNTNNENNEHLSRNVLAQSAYDFQWYNAKDINKLGYGGNSNIENSNLFDKKGIWIIFDDGTSTGKELTKSITEKNQKCINVIQGKEYKVFEGGSVISLNPSNEDEFDRLLSNITEKSNLEICGTVYLWNLKVQNKSEDVDVSYIKKFQSISCMSIIYFIKACEKKNLIVPISIITRGVQAIGNNVDVQALIQSPVWGLGRIIAYQEYPDMFGSLIDLDPSCPDDEIKCIVNEIQNRNCENQVAFRNGDKYFPRIIKSNIQENKIPIKFNPHKSYVVTGGFGALGKLVIEYMAKNGAKRFVVLSRTKLLDHKLWKNSNKDAKMEDRISFIRKMERMGVTINVGAVDVSNFDELKQYISDYYKMELPEIGGVIHCAGIIKDKLISNMTENDFNSVIIPKIGAWNLHRVFKNTKLDFFILFSSVASVLNITMGQANYAAANSFMDTLSSYRRAQGLTSISINWGPWSDVGMATQSELISYFSSKGIKSITPNQGMKMLEDILGYSKSQIIILNAKWNILKNSFSKENIPPAISYLCNKNVEEVEENNTNKAVLEDIFKVNEKDKRKEKLTKYLTNIIMKAFGAGEDELNNNKALSEMGMDSLMAVDIKRDIEAVFNIKISMIELMEGISINELADKLLYKLSHKK